MSTDGEAADAIDVDDVFVDHDEDVEADELRRHPRRGPVVTSLAGFEDPRPLHQVVRGWRWAPWLLAGLLILRFLAVVGLRLYLYFDSSEYDRIDFSGDWRRPWATPWLYWLIPGTNRSILIGQALLGAVCWGVLALSAAAWFRLPTMRWVVAVTIAGLACTTTVTNWDATKLSESLGLSLTVLVVAAWLNFLRRTEWMTAIWLLVAFWPWLFVRQSLLSAAWLVVLCAAIGAVIAWRRGHASKVLAVVALTMAVQVGLASVSYSHNQEVVQENLRVIVANRIATNPARLDWFEDHGMPVPASGKLDYEALKADAKFREWVKGEGRSTYVKFLLTHPWYTATEPLDDFTTLHQSYAEEPVTYASMLAPREHYATSRPVLPTFLEVILFEPGGTGAAIFSLVIASGWTLARLRRRSMRWTVPWLLILISFASLYTGWHGATPELGRLALLGAIGLRIGVLLQLAFLLEGELISRRATAVVEDVTPTS